VTTARHEFRGVVKLQADFAEAYNGLGLALLEHDQQAVREDHWDLGPRADGHPAREAEPVGNPATRRINSRLRWAARGTHDSCEMRRFEEI
jgi:hypothetical protein